MEFKFTNQQYQFDAVNNIVNVFKGQINKKSFEYRFDKGKNATVTLFSDYGKLDVGYGNGNIELNDVQLLKNINEIQSNDGIILSKELNKSLGRCSLDIEMETGTGKTFVYIKSMYELNKAYGWSKFIVVVPSIAIREGVKKTFETTEKYFMENYNKKIRYFVYNSSNLHDIDDFSQSNDICALIINSQAFATSFKEGAKNEASRIIYSERDEFGSRRPIDVLAANNPILILDEPQKLEGAKTQAALKNNFNALFSMNFSATHKTPHNKIYILDALDAFNKKLVKKIEVKGIEMNAMTGISAYLFLEEIVLDPNIPPRARLEFEVKRASGNPTRKTSLFKEGDSLYSASGNLETYKNIFITRIDAVNGYIELSNGAVLTSGSVTGDSSEMNLRRIQIREVIKSHFEKEETLFKQGIKCLTLFFLDSVSNYRIYDDDGNEHLGQYGKIFEEEYSRYLKEHEQFYDPDYMQYVKNIPMEKTHNGYFSIDKKSKNMVDPAVGKRSDISDDESAYDLIMKDKERLLSFEEPTRFIFSHSALREGWDNPNIFQICALKHSDSNTYRRQEVGRGLRLCVDREGNRMDVNRCGASYIHELNTLTVVAGEGYDSFVKQLQSDTAEYIAERPIKADFDYFKGRRLETEVGELIIDETMAKNIYKYLIKKDYLDEKDEINEKCRNAIQGECLLEDLPEPFSDFAKPLTELVRAISENRDPKSLYSDGRKTKIKENPLNSNFDKKEFQELWDRINDRYVYRVEFDSDELIRKSIASIDENLHVTPMSYTVSTGEQKKEVSANDLTRGDSFERKKTESGTLENVGSDTKYDLIGSIAGECKLTRKTICRILQGLEDKVFDQFKQNPEEFIQKVVKLIKNEEATAIVDHISYSKLDRKFESSIFTMSKASSEYEKAFEAKKHIQDYVFTDGIAEKSVEREFAEDLDQAEEVVVYAKLPRTFYIPTPVGNYSPDWAIAFDKHKVKHIYFVAETKGSMDSMQLRGIEDAKIKCAKELFKTLEDKDVRYHQVTTYKNLLDLMNEE